MNKKRWAKLNKILRKKILSWGPIMLILVLLLTAISLLDKKDQEQKFDGKINLHTEYLPSFEEFSERRAYINPKILKNKSKIVMPGLSGEQYKPDRVERSFRDDIWYGYDSSEDTSSRSSQYVQLEKIKSLRLGEKTPTGTRAAVYTIDSSDKDIFLVQVGIQEFPDPELEKIGGYPFGLSFTLAEDYECNLAKLSCVETDLLNKADAHMTANDIFSKTGHVYYFWQFWNRNSDSIIGYKTGEGAFPDVVYMYHPSHNDHTQIDTPNGRFIFSPSMQKLIIFPSENKIITYELKDDFIQVQTSNYSHLKIFFEEPYSDYTQPLYSSRKEFWSEDESVVYFIQDQRIFSYNTTTGAADRLIDATALYDLPKAHAESIDKDKIQAIGPYLSKSGHYLYYSLHPFDQSQKDTQVIIDLFDENKSKEFIIEQ